MPAGPGGRVRPRRRDPQGAINDFGDGEPGERCSGEQGRHRRDSRTVCRKAPPAAMRGAQRILRRGGTPVWAVAGPLTSPRGTGNGRVAPGITPSVTPARRALGPERPPPRQEGRTDRRRVGKEVDMHVETG